MKKTFRIRQAILEMCIKAGTCHVTSSLPSIDILVAFYYGGIFRVDPKNPEWEERDRFLLSHARVRPALYSILGGLAFFSAYYHRGASAGGLGSAVLEVVNDHRTPPPSTASAYQWIRDIATSMAEERSSAGTMALIIKPCCGKS